ncbi:2Og-Fe(Ii) oxygenase [Arthrobacter sp. Hiyo4]|nr:2Og-Fe(Ii) oxygenase [Arthrobacter sp. Hiyo4]
MSPDQATIPVLDMSAARQPYGAFSPEFIDQLRDAAHNVGFFQITGYGAAPARPRSCWPSSNASSICPSRSG